MERDLARYDPSSNRLFERGHGAKTKKDMLDSEKLITCC